MNILLNERFEILRELGAGSQGITYLAFDKQDQIEVAVKKLAVEKIENWKCLELFDRESKVTTRTSRLHYFLKNEKKSCEL